MLQNTVHERINIIIPKKFESFMVSIVEFLTCSFGFGPTAGPIYTDRQRPLN